jgi:hypothetical protein
VRPGFFKFILNVYPPYWGTGIVVDKISADFREIIVRMKLHWYNRNYFKTHFGGSLYAMTDPFYALMLIKILGEEFLVIDRAAAIDYRKPGRGTVTARFVIEDDVLADILARTAGGESYLPKLTVDVTDERREIVARVVKTLYVRRKSENGSSPGSTARFRS